MNTQSKLNQNMNKRRSPLQEIGQNIEWNHEREESEVSGKDIFELITQGIEEYSNQSQKLNEISPKSIASLNSSISKIKSPIIQSSHKFQFSVQPVILSIKLI